MPSEAVFDLAEVGFRSDAIGIAAIGICVALFTEWVLRRPKIREQGVGWFRALAWTLFAGCLVLLYADWRDYTRLLSAYRTNATDVVTGAIADHRIVRCDSTNGEQITVAGRAFRLCRELDAIAFTNTAPQRTLLRRGRVVRMTTVGARIVRFETLPQARVLHSP